MPLPFPVWSSTLMVYEYEYLLNTLRYLLYAESYLSGRAYIRRRSVDTNLVEIHAKLSELLVCTK